MVVIIGFPKFAGDSQVIVAVARDEFVPWNFVPFLRGGDARCAQRVNSQTDGRAPRNCVLDELHFAAVPGKKEWAGAFQALLGQDFLVGFEREFGADRSIGPDDACDVGTGVFAKSEVELRSGYGLFLGQQCGADFDFAADSERVYALVSRGLSGARADDLPVIVFGAVIELNLGLAVESKA